MPTSPHRFTLFTGPLVCLIVGLFASAWPPAHGQTLSTPMSTSGPQYSFAVFDIKSLTGVNITGFSTSLGSNPWAQGQILRSVWKRNTVGSFSGFENDQSEWSHVITTTFGHPTPPSQPMTFIDPVTILPGETQAFCVFFFFGATQRFQNAPAIGSVVAGNSHLEIHAGRGGTVAPFSFTSGPEAWNGSVHYTTLQTFNDDISVEKMTAPSTDGLGCIDLSSTELVSIDIRNRGFNLIPAGTQILISYQANGGSVVSELVALASDLPSWGLLSHTFATTADLSGPGNHTIVASTIYSGDQDLNNDTLTVTVPNGGQVVVTNYPYRQPFDVPSGFPINGFDLPTGWVNEVDDAMGLNSDWQVIITPTLNTGTGPSGSHSPPVSSGNSAYAFINGLSNFNAVNLRTPCFDLSGMTTPTLQFFMHSQNAALPMMGNELSIDVHSFPSGAVTLDVFGPEGHIGPDWTLRSVDLSAFAGQKVQLVFRGSTNFQNTLLAHDIAIDDITIEDAFLTRGQAPRGGVAVLDIGQSTNASGNVTSLELGGPYFVTATTGETLTIKMEGEPLKPIIMFSGPLNPIAASYPGIGTVDLGGAIIPNTGIPSLLTIVGDGSLPGGINPFFFTGISGLTNLYFTVPAMPPGILGNFQCVFPTQVPGGLALSNAVQVSVQ